MTSPALRNTGGFMPRPTPGGVPVVTTGTPPGVGLGMKPQVFLKAGDVMKLGIEGLGEQQQKVVPFKM